MATAPEMHDAPVQISPKTLLLLLGRLKAHPVGALAGKLPSGPAATGRTAPTHVPPPLRWWAGTWKRPAGGAQATMEQLALCGPTHRLAGPDSAVKIVFITAPAPLRWQPLSPGSAPRAGQQWQRIRAAHRQRQQALPTCTPGALPWWPAKVTRRRGLRANNLCALPRGKQQRKHGCPAAQKDDRDATAPGSMGAPLQSTRSCGQHHSVRTFLFLERRP